MWYLIGLFICLAYIIIMPFIRYKDYWNVLIPTFGENIAVWNTLLGHFLACIIPANLTYNEYSQIVGDDYSEGCGLILLAILLGCIALWFIAIPLIFIIITFLSIKTVIQNFIKNQATKHDPK